jgi:hypothetical protein
MKSMVRARIYALPTSTKSSEYLAKALPNRLIGRFELYQWDSGVL